MRFAMRLLAMGALVAGVLLLLHSMGLLIWQCLELMQTKTWPALPTRLWFVDHSSLHGAAVSPVLPFIPEFDGPLGRQFAASWIVERLHIGVVPALLGALLVWGGRIVILRETEAMRASQQRKEDRMRRAQIYRRERAVADERKEPVLNGEPLAIERRAASNRG